MNIRKSVVSMAAVAIFMVASTAYAYIFGPYHPNTTVSSTSQSTFTEFLAIGTSGDSHCVQHYVCPGPVELCAFHPTGDYDMPNLAQASINLNLANAPTSTSNYKFNVQGVGDIAAASVTVNGNGTITVLSEWYTHPGGPGNGYREARAYVKRGAAGDVTYTANTSDLFNFGVLTSCPNTFE